MTVEEYARAKRKTNEELCVLSAAAILVLVEAAEALGDKDFEQRLENTAYTQQTGVSFFAKDTAEPS
jgi:hypothetical protein